GESKDRLRPSSYILCVPQTLVNSRARDQNESWHTTQHFQFTRARKAGQASEGTGIAYGRKFWAAGCAIVTARQTRNEERRKSSWLSVLCWWDSYRRLWSSIRATKCPGCPMLGTCASNSTRTVAPLRPMCFRRQQECVCKAGLRGPARRQVRTSTGYG